MSWYCKLTGSGSVAGPFLVTFPLELGTNEMGDEGS